MAAAPPTAKVRPFRILPRTESGAVGSKCSASAMSLRMTMSWPDWSFAVTSAVSFWPRALARVIDGADDIEKSAEPEITAFIAPMPVMYATFTSSPCCAHKCSSAATYCTRNSTLVPGIASTACSSAARAGASASHGSVAAANQVLSRIVFLPVRRRGAERCPRR